MNIILKKIKITQIKLLLKLHSFLYFYVSKISKDLEDDKIHPKHRIMNYHQFFVENIDNNSFVLDIGCGNGALTYDIAKKAEKVIGIDLNEKNIAEANKKFYRENIKYINGNALTDLPNYDFDIIVMSNVLEHIENRVDFLKSIRSMASKFLFRVPMIERSWIDLYKKELGLEYRLDDTHFIEYTLENFENEVNQGGLKIVKKTIKFGEIWAVVCAK